MQQSCHKLAGTLTWRYSKCVDGSGKIHIGVKVEYGLHTTLAVAVRIPVRNKSSPKERAIHRLRWTKLWSFAMSSFLQVESAFTYIGMILCDFCKLYRFWKVHI